ncbi:MAG: PAS domain-containing sensor histidine kinase, partial [Dehalococcoidia bacterium]
MDNKVKYAGILFGALVLLGLYLTSRTNYLLFHSLAELFSIIVAIGIFALAWHTRRSLANNYILFIGIAYLFVGGIDLLHTLGYTGMGVFTGYGTNLPTELWIAARYIESLSLFIAPLFIGRKLNANLAFIGYALVTALLLVSIFTWNIFPDSFIEGTGLTAFKKTSEYVISAILLGSLYLLSRKRTEFDRTVFRLLAASIIVTIGSELLFTLYT